MLSAIVEIRSAFQWIFTPKDLLFHRKRLKSNLDYDGGGGKGVLGAAGEAIGRSLQTIKISVKMTCIYAVDETMVVAKVLTNRK